MWHAKKMRSSFREAMRRAPPNRVPLRSIGRCLNLSSLSRQRDQQRQPRECPDALSTPCYALCVPGSSSRRGSVSRSIFFVYANHLLSCFICQNFSIRRLKRKNQLTESRTVQWNEFCCMEGSSFHSLLKTRFPFGYLRIWDMLHHQGLPKQKKGDILFLEIWHAFVLFFDR